MQITENEKYHVIDALRSEPKWTVSPMVYSTLEEKTGLPYEQLKAVNAELLKEGRIWQERQLGRGPLTYLVCDDKRKQILDLLEERVSVHCSGSLYFRPVARHCHISVPHAETIILGLLSEGLITIKQLEIAPSNQLCAAIRASRAIEVAP